MEETEKNEETCRLCDDIGGQMFNIFDKNQEGNQIIQVIKDCLPIIIYRTDPLSKQVCESCLKNINTLHKFKKTAQEIAEKQKEKLQACLDTSNEELPLPIRLFLACEDEMEEGSELKDVSTGTDDIAIFCDKCKQPVTDPNTVNGELELCTDLRKVIAESMRKNKITTESTDKSLRRRKVVPFYHELDDSLCSSLTEYTQNTEESQCFDEPSDMDESLESDEIPASRSSKRRRLESDEENDNESNSTTKRRATMVEDVPILDAEEEEENDENSNSNSNINIDTLEDMFAEEEEFRYQPLSMLELCLNVMNKINIPDYEPDEFVREIIYPKCNYCEEQFQNLKILALHEIKHLDVDVGEKIDNPIPWESSKEDAGIRNKWLNYFDENGYEDEDIVIEDVVSTDNLLIPVDEGKGETRTLTGEEKISLDGTQPLVNGVYLGDYTKEERKTFYQTMRIQGVNKKFCDLCRYTFKDNWAIESHYFSSACYYTCRYCGMRFNKQRHKFDEHVEEHKKEKHEFSDKIYAASKLSNVVPKVIHPPKERPKKVVPIQPTPPEINNHQNNVNNGPPYTSLRVRNLMERRSLQPNMQIVKEEPSDSPRDFITSQSKTGNQAYFCRKCYKVFFKLDEFNIHSKNCDYNQFPQIRNFSKPAFHSKNGEVSPAGRPVRHCAKEGPYKDEVYLPDHIMRQPRQSQPPPGQQQQSGQTFVCFICNTPFPTIYSRNSHMRIHKGEMPNPSPPFRPRPPQNVQNNFQNYRATPSPQFNNHFMMENVKIKEEPMDMPMEPMVEIHEPEPEPAFPDSLGGGAVSITPIIKAKPKPALSPNVMKFVQNNPAISLKPNNKPQQASPSSSSNPHGQMNQIQHQMNQMNQMNQMMGGFQDPDKTYKCSSCWEAFANKSHLYFHKKNQCEGSRFPCPFCKKRFGTEAEYSSHIYYSHPE